MYTRPHDWPYCWPNSFMTNIRPEKAKFIRRAAQLTYYDVVVRPLACDSRGRPLKDRVAVHTYERGRDHTPFWQAYEALQELAEGAAKR
jgi:hypothetical protein